MVDGRFSYVNEYAKLEMFIFKLLYKYKVDFISAIWCLVAGKSDRFVTNILILCPSHRETFQLVCDEHMDFFVFCQQVVVESFIVHFNLFTWSVFDAIKIIVLLCLCGVFNAHELCVICDSIF